MKPVYFEDDHLVLIDQTRLPGELVYENYTDYRDIIPAIKQLVVRGAPAIGVAAAYAVYLAAEEFRNEPDFDQKLKDAAAEIRQARPTAVNLMWAVDRMMKVYDEYKSLPVAKIVEELKTCADAIDEEDIEMCRSIGRHGQELLKDGDTVLTHCNAGALATADYGTALGVIRGAVDAGKQISVYADETRPLLQGARLTTWELHEDGIPVTLITDNMAGWMMKQGKIDAVITGADRIAANGDAANKIGTYSVSVLAKYHGIPMYIAAPSSTIDMKTPSGDDIVIEERNPEEVFGFGGVRTAPEGIRAENPAFDVSPHENITAIITEKGVIYPPFDENLRRLFDQN